MALLNPAPNFKFQVYLFDTDLTSPSDLGDFAIAAVGAATSIATSLIFGGFNEVNGLTAEMEVEEYREGGWHMAPRRFVKFGKYPPLTLKRGVSFTPDLWDWHYQAMLGSSEPIRKNGIIILNDRGRGALETPTPVGIPILDTVPVSVWFMTNGLPQKMELSQLKGTGNEIAIETLEIAHEGLFRLGTAQIPGAGDVMAATGL